jgi:hypothetical protein
MGKLDKIYFSVRIHTHPASAQESYVETPQITAQIGDVSPQHGTLPASFGQVRLSADPSTRLAFQSRRGMRVVNPSPCATNSYSLFLISPGLECKEVPQPFSHKNVHHEVHLRGFTTY